MRAQDIGIPLVKENAEDAKLARQAPRKGRHKPADSDPFHEALQTLALYWLTVNLPPQPLVLGDGTEKPV
jgi:hypothetical protein